MKFKLLINPKKDEFVQAQVHQENDFTKELKDFVLTNGNFNQLLVYDDKDAITLSLDDIALITIIDDKLTLFAIIRSNTVSKREFIN